TTSPLRSHPPSNGSPIAVLADEVGAVGMDAPCQLSSHLRGKPAHLPQIGARPVHEHLLQLRLERSAVGGGSFLQTRQYSLGNLTNEDVGHLHLVPAITMISFAACDQQLDADTAVLRPQGGLE